MLRMLYTLYPGAVRAPELLQIAAALGADIPLPCTAARSTHRASANSSRPLACAKPLHFVLLKPAQGARHQSDLCRIRSSPGCRTADHVSAIKALALGDAQALAAALQNVLQPHAQSLLPQIGHLCERLSQCGALCACMTGSGSAVFGLFASAQAARHAQAQLRTEAPLCVYATKRAAACAAIARVNAMAHCARAPAGRCGCALGVARRNPASFLSHADRTHMEMDAHPLASFVYTKRAGHPFAVPRS